MDIIPGPYGDTRTVADSQIETLGHPGKYYNTVTVTTSAQLDCTGSKFGFSSVLKSGSYDGNITLTGGGIINAGNLTAGVIYDLSVLKVSGGTTGGLYVIRKGF
jgi:hypothetical protein